MKIKENEDTKLRLTCFADETGQDTKGRFFLVATCIIESDKENTIETLLGNIEIQSNKKFRKWNDSSNLIRTNFISVLQASTFPMSSLYYSSFSDSKQYAELMSLVIAKTVLHKAKDKKYRVKIFFDRINKKTESKIKIELKKLNIKYSKIRGMKDESLALIRLTDSIAGFMRDYLEGKKYTAGLREFAEKIIKI